MWLVGLYDMASSLPASSDREPFLQHRHPAGAGNNERVVAGGESVGWDVEVDRLARLLGGVGDGVGRRALRVDDLAGVRRRVDVGRYDEFDGERRMAVFDGNDLLRLPHLAQLDRRWRDPRLARLCQLCAERR